MSIRLKLTLLLVCLFLASIINAIFTFQLEKYGEEKLEWVNHTHNVLLVSGKLLSSMADAETGQRGYLLATNTSYLEPYHNGIIVANKSLLELKTLTSDNNSQQKILESVETYMKLKFDELAETIKLMDNGEKNKAFEIVKQNKGKQYMDSIRAHINLFNNAERILLEKRKGDFRENRAQIMTLITVELLFFIGLSILTFTFIKKSFFLPLALLLSGTKKIEKGKKLDIVDVVEKNEMGHLLSTFFVMSEKVQKRAEVLDFKAKHDELTGLKNRITMLDEIDDAIHGLKSSGDKLAILFLDLNSFKQINDTLGHDVGDLILIETAARLNSSVRNSDSVFRIGGDEFLIITRNVKKTSDINDIVSKILTAFEPKAIIHGKSIEISTSIGVAVSPDATDNSSEIVKYSDIAMYVAKREKGCSYKVFDKSMLKRSSDA